MPRGEKAYKLESRLPRPDAVSATGPFAVIWSYTDCGAGGAGGVARAGVGGGCL